MNAVSNARDADCACFGSRLNADQLQAATYGDRANGSFASGPLLIIAGAGTGKTNTLAHRVAYLLLQGVDPASILLLTFTRRAAQEMLRRAERITADTMQANQGTKTFHPNATRMLWSGTFHAIGNRLLREYATSLGLDPAFSVIDRGDAADLARRAATGIRIGAQGKALPAQGHLPCDLLASCQYARAAGSRR